MNASSRRFGRRRNNARERRLTECVVGLCSPRSVLRPAAIGNKKPARKRGVSFQASAAFRGVQPIYRNALQSSNKALSDAAASLSTVLNVTDVASKI